MSTLLAMASDLKISATDQRTLLNDENMQHALSVLLASGKNSHRYLEFVKTRAQQFIYKNLRSVLAGNVEYIFLYRIFVTWSLISILMQKRKFIREAEQNPNLPPPDPQQQPDEFTWKLRADLLAFNEAEDAPSANELDELMAKGSFVPFEVRPTANLSAAPSRPVDVLLVAGPMTVGAAEYNKTTNNRLPIAFSRTFTKVMSDLATTNKGEFVWSESKLVLFTTHSGSNNTIWKTVKRKQNDVTVISFPGAWQPGVMKGFITFAEKSSLMSTADLEREYRDLLQSSLTASAEYDGIT